MAAPTVTVREELSVKLPRRLEGAAGERQGAGGGAQVVIVADGEHAVLEGRAAAVVAAAGEDLRAGAAHDQGDRAGAVIDGPAEGRRAGGRRKGEGHRTAATLLVTVPPLPL